MKRPSGPYPLGEIPRSVICEIGKQIAHRLAVGNADIDGEFGSIFARAIGGLHPASPVGIADVGLNDCAWSAKTVKGVPFRPTSTIRIIAARIDLLHSSGISDRYADIQATGRAVLQGWNQRLGETLCQHDDARIVVLVRDMSRLRFALFEQPAIRFVPEEYTWRLNDNNNIEGFCSQSNVHRFTWQPAQTQFTLKLQLPDSTRFFQFAKKPGLIQEHQVLESIGFSETWIEDINLPDSSSSDLH